MLSSVQRELPVQPDVMDGVCAAAECGDVERGPVFHSLVHRDSGGCLCGTCMNKNQVCLLSMFILSAKNTKLLLSNMCNISLTKDVLLLSLQHTQME